MAVDAVEILTKHALARPLLTARFGGRELGVVDFVHSFPSGHAARAVVVAALLSSLRPRLAPFAVAWAVLTLPALELAGFHTPSDVAGGALLAGAAVLVARAALTPPDGATPRTRSRRSSRRP